VQLKYRLYRRRNGVFYWQDNGSKKQGSLRTKDRREAERLLNAMNESHREPTLNLNLARAYLAAHDAQKTDNLGRFLSCALKSTVLFARMPSNFSARRRNCAGSLGLRFGDELGEARIFAERVPGWIELENGDSETVWYLAQMIE
jgi:hypothetical protein